MNQPHRSLSAFEQVELQETLEKVREKWRELSDTTNMVEYSIIRAEIDKLLGIDTEWR